MKPYRETEIKLKVSSPRKLFALLKRLGFRRIAPRQRERNVLFDFRDGAMARQRKALRLRTSGHQGTLTLKGPPRFAGGHKSREEIEIQIADADALRQILSRLGLRESARYGKHRTTFAVPGKSRNGPRRALVYDETPIGNFIELEGPPGWIDRVARLLGYKVSDYITESYIALYAHARTARKKARP